MPHWPQWQRIVHNAAQPDPVDIRRNKTKCCYSTFASWQLQFQWVVHGSVTDTEACGWLHSVAGIMEQLMIRLKKSLGAFSQSVFFS